MKRLLPLLLLASCASPSVSPEVRSIVPLIKAERYDEAAGDPDLLAPAFVEALRQLNAEGADPKKVVRIADFFFDNYPFAIRDLPLDDSILIAAGEEHFKAASKLEPALPSCASFQAAPTFIAKHEILSSWKEPHRDGGRCARELRFLLDRALERGKDWIFDSSLSGQKLGYSGENELVDDCDPLLGNQPGYLLLRIASQPVQRLWSWWACDSWASSTFQESERWSRMYWSRAAWLAALRHTPVLDSISRFADPLPEYRFDPRIPKLAEALRAWGKLAISLQSDWQPDPAEFRRAVDAVVRCGPGTPFPDLARYTMIASLARGGRLAEAEACAEEFRRSSTSPFSVGHGLLEIIELRMEDDKHVSHDEALRLCRKVVEWDPRGYSASTAWATQAKIHDDAGRAREREECLVAAATLPLPEGPYEDDDPYFARSEAGRNLARLYQERKSWDASLAAWRAWEPYTWCATCGWGQDEDKNLGIATSLEALGRVGESLDFYWEAARGQGSEAIDVAKKLLELHRVRATTAELRTKVEKEVEAYSDKSQVDHGLKWLAGELGVPLK